MAKDILLDENDDLLFRDGDLVIGDTTQQEIRLIVQSFKGAWKESPMVGVGIKRLIKSRASRVAIKKEIKNQLQDDAFENITINIDYPNITVNATKE